MMGSNREKNTISVGNLSTHILPAASNLLGICFLIFSFIRVSGNASITRLDEFLVIPIFMFFAASCFSYFSLRSNRSRFERLADVFFIVALFILSLISLAFVFESI